MIYIHIHMYLLYDSLLKNWYQWIRPWNIDVNLNFSSAKEIIQNMWIIIIIAIFNFSHFSRFRTSLICALFLFSQPSNF